VYTCRSQPTGCIHLFLKRFAFICPIRPICPKVMYINNLEVDRYQTDRTHTPPWCAGAGKTNVCSLPILQLRLSPAPHFIASYPVGAHLSKRWEPPSSHFALTTTILHRLTAAFSEVLPHRLITQVPVQPRHAHLCVVFISSMTFWSCEGFFGLGPA
jgi:hypothetical protein